MPSTYTVNLGIEKPATGEQSGTWGDTTNLNFDILDQAINGAISITLASAETSGSPNTLAISDGSTSDGRNKWIEFVDGGDLGASAYVKLTPSDAEKIVFIRNSLSGSRSVILFQGTYDAGRDLEVPAGVDMVVKFSGGGATATTTDVFTKLRATEITTPTLTAGTADINDGTVEAVIGGTTPKAGTFTTLTANTNLTVNASTTVDGIIDDDTMATASATKLSTSESIKAYVDSQVGTVDTLAEILANGNTSGANNLIIDNGQAITTNTVNETTAGSGVTIDSVLLKDDGVNATNLEITNIKANDGTAAGSIANSTGAVTITSFISNSVDIGGGAIDDTVIGGTTPASISGTTGTFSGNLTVDTNTLYVDSANNRVGIGTTSPDRPLEVVATNTTMKITGSGVSSTGIVFETNSTERKQIGIPSGDTALAFYSDAGSTEAMRITSTGNVGIGTTSPNELLQVNSTGSSTAIEISAGQASVTTGEAKLVLRSPHSSSGTTYSRSEIASLGVAGGDSDLIFRTTTTSAGPVEAMRIDSSGNVGIGTSSPTSKLHVAGDVTIDTNANGATLTIHSPNQTWSGGENLGGIDWYTEDPSGDAPGVIAKMYVESKGGNTLPISQMVFSSAYASGITQIEHLRLDPDGGSSSAIFAGDVILSNNESLYSRNNADSADLEIARINTSDQLLLGGGATSTIIKTAGAGNSLTINASGDATFAGDVTVSGGNIGVGTAASTRAIDVLSATNDTLGSGVRAKNSNNGTAAAANFTVESATSSGSLLAYPSNSTVSDYADRVVLKTNSDAAGLTIATGVAGGDIVLRTASDTTALTLDSSQNATFAGDVDVDGTTTSDGVVTDTTNGFKINTSTVVEASWTHVVVSGESTINVGRNSSWGGKLIIQTDLKNRAKFASNGDISFYEDTGTTEKFFWDASAESLGIGTSSPARQLHLAGTTANIRLDGTSVGGYLEFKNPTNTNYIGTPASISSGSTTDLAFYTSGLERMRIDTSGNVGIGTSSPTSKLHVAGDATITGTLNVLTAIDLADNDILRFGTGDDCEFFCDGSHMYTDLNAGIGNWYVRDGTTTRFTFDDAGSFTATANITAYSDRKLKGNLEVIPNALSKVSQLTGYTYDRIDMDGVRQSGLIAQDVQEVLPEVVINNVDPDSGEETLSVAYGNMIGLLVEAIKELKAEVEELKGGK